MSKSELIERPKSQQLRSEGKLDLVNVPASLALPLLSNELATLASNMTDLKDLSVQIDISPSGATSMRFRAYSRF